MYQAENKVSLVLLTNQFEVAAQVITDLYHQRWQVELFFKWIKQRVNIFEQTPLQELLATNPSVLDCEKDDKHSQKLLLLNCL